MSEWMSTKETSRLPENDADVLIFYRGRIAIGNWDGANWYSPGGAWISSDFVTHWRFLPAPPEANK